jgi:hypothetical protein
MVRKSILWVPKTPSVQLMVWWEIASATCSTYSEQDPNKCARHHGRSYGPTPDATARDDYAAESISYGELSE